MRRGGSLGARCQLSTVSNLADVLVGCTGLEGEVGYVTVSFSEGAVYLGKNLPRMGFESGWVHAYFLCTCVCGECVLYLQGVHF